METQGNLGGKQQNSEDKMPDQATLKEWVKKDLDAAIAFLMAIREHPEIIEDVTQRLASSALHTGPVIDRVTQPKTE